MVRSISYKLLREMTLSALDGSAIRKPIVERGTGPFGWTVMIHDVQKASQEIRLTGGLIVRRLGNAIDLPVI